MTTGQDIPRPHRNEKITLIVVIITLLTMVVEIIAGIISGSMALLSDGIHMGTHAIALFITLAAYIFARKNKNNPQFIFGTGKIGVLGGYTNAILLLTAAGAMAVESVRRLVFPVDIMFNEAIIVAVIGLGINIVSAFILRKGNVGPVQSHSHGHHDHDHNLTAAYLHVIADALTSVLAIAALLTAKYFHFIWADPLVGILGALLVSRWAIGLLRQTSTILLDKGDFASEIDSLKSAVESGSTRVKDIRLWHISENGKFLVMSIETNENHGPAYYRDMVKGITQYDHIAIEVNTKQDPAS